MQSLAHDIEKYILNLLEDEGDNIISLRRKELAEMFSCVPSQINYVLRSRFRPEHGFLIDSRRGEHGYIKILRVTCETPDEKLNHIAGLVGDEISLKEARRLLEALQERELITGRERLLIEIALRHLAEGAGNVETEEMADLLKSMLGSIMTV
ncbi:MAG: CtsR family transcriptional regulator [Synergistaceae bacterium]|nr:CtsR family transcriptional regulator [Synergistaceae bacterium]